MSLFPIVHRYPPCCRDCKWLTTDDNDYSGDWFYVCGRSIWLPIKTQTCKCWKPKEAVVA